MNRLMRWLRKWYRWNRMDARRSREFSDAMDYWRMGRGINS